MNELFEMLGAVTRRRKAIAKSPFASPKAVEKWLKNLPVDSDYDAHHALVEGLERFNAENEVATLARMKALLKVEAAGLDLQIGIVEQYVRNQATFRLARQALWRESWAFWSLLAEAWLSMLKQAYRGQNKEDLNPFVADIAARAMRYSRLVMRWDYHQARVPSGSAWRRLHKIYRLVERDGFDLQDVKIQSQTTNCAREYTLAVLMGLVHPLGYRTQEIESIAHILEAYEALPLPTSIPQREIHTHVVDLSLSEGASVMDDDWVQGRRLRYFALNALVAYLKDMDHALIGGVDDTLTRQVASLIERGGIQRNRQRTNRFGRVWVAAGMDDILGALAKPDTSASHWELMPWMLRDESPEGMGFALDDKTELPHGRLIAVSWEPSENVWQLLAIRWNRQEDGQHMIGTQRLSRHPKRVELFADATTLADGREADKIWALFLPMTQTEQGVSHLLIPRRHYHLGAAMLLRDGDMVYRLRLGEIQEIHEGWLRVGMDVIGREQYAAAA